MLPAQVVPNPTIKQQHHTYFIELSGQPYWIHEQCDVYKYIAKNQ